MAGFNTIRNYNYNRSLESLRNKVDQKIYQKRMQIIQERKRAKSVRSLMDIFFNAEARERLDGDNWFDTTIKATGEWFNHNFIEWGRNPVNALLNNLGAIGDDLDYAANLIKAPLIASAKGEDVGERLTDAYGLGDKGRITQNMSDLREALGAYDSGAEIGTVTGFSTLTGAEIGSRGGLIGVLIGALVGATVGAISSGIDAGVRESGTNNEFLKGTQTVCNTISDMMMEFSVDPANLFGAIGNISEASKTQSIMDKLAKNEPASLDNFKSSLKGERAFKSEEVLANAYHGSAQLAQEPIKKGNKEIIRTAEQQRKFVERRMKNVIHAYMNGDKKAFNKSLIETGIGKYLSDDPKVLEQQIEGMYKVFRHDANMSAIGRFGAFVNNYDAKFAHLLYKGTVPGLTITTAKKAFMKAHKAWETALLETAKKFEAGEITTKTIPINPSRGILQKAAEKHYYKFFDSFKDLEGKYIIKDGMTQKQLAESYEAMSKYIKLFNAKRNYREAKILQGMMRNIVLDNGTVKIKLGDAEDAIKSLNKNFVKAIKLLDEDVDTNLNTILKLFYFENGIDYFKLLMYNPATFKGNFNSMLDIAEKMTIKANKIVEEDPNYLYKTELNNIAKDTFKWDIFNTDVNKYYDDKFHELISKTLARNNYMKMDVEERQHLLKDIDDLLNRRDLSEDAINRINETMYEEAYSEVLDEINIYEYDKLPGDYLDKYSPEALMEYQGMYKDARRGAKIRTRFNSYNDAISESSNTIIKIDKQSELLSNDINSIQHSYNIHMKDIFERAKKEYIDSKNNVSNELVEELNDEVLALIRGLWKNISDANPTSFDITMSGTGQTGKASTQLFNVVSKSRIKKPKNVDNLTDAEWFLKEFKKQIKLSTEVANDTNLNISEVIKELTHVTNYLKTNKNIFLVLDSKGLKNSITNKAERKALIRNIVNYIMGNTNDIDSRITNLFNLKGEFRIKVSEADFIDSLDTLRNELSNSAYLYNKLCSTFRRSFLNGRSAVEDVNKILTLLKFASEDNAVNLRNGNFVDSFIQQTVFKDTIEGLSDDINMSSADIRDMFKNVFTSLNKNMDLKEVYTALDTLYSKRMDLVNNIVELQNNPKALAEFKQALADELNRDYNSRFANLIFKKANLSNVYSDRIKNTPVADPTEFGFSPDSTYESLDNYLIERAKLYNSEYKLLKNTIAYDDTDIPYDPLMDSNIKKSLSAYDAKLKEVEQYNAKTSSIKNELETTELKLNKLEKEYNDKLKNINELKTYNAQLAYIERFQKESDAIYNKINSLTRLMFINNLDDSKFIFKNNKQPMDVIYNFSNIKLPKKQRNTLVEAFLNDLDSRVLGTADYNNMTKFLNNFFTTITRVDSEIAIRTFNKISNIAIRGGVYDIISNDQHYILKAKDFDNLFNRIGGIEKSLWLRNYLIDYLGLNPLFKTDISFKNIKSKLVNIYTDGFNNMLTGDEQVLSEKAVEDFNKVIKQLDSITSSLIGDSLHNNRANLINANKVTKKKLSSVFTKTNNYTSKFVDNSSKKAFEDAISQSKYKIWDEPYISTITIDDNDEVVVNSISCTDLKYNMSDEDIIKTTHRPIIDIETTAKEKKNKDKRVLQITVRLSDKESYNIMVMDPTLDNTYRGGKNELLDADLVNGNFEKLGGILDAQNSNNLYTMYIYQGQKYMLFNTQESAADYLENLCLKNGMIDATGQLSFAGHNSSGFDAEVLLRFLNNYGSGKVKSIGTTDTMWLARAIMAAEMGKGFEDNTSANLSNLYKVWIGENSLLENAHNADADTLMTYRLLNKIREKMSDSPKKFFRDNLTDNVNIDTSFIEKFNKKEELFILNDKKFYKTVNIESINDLIDINVLDKLAEKNKRLSSRFLNQIWDEYIDIKNSLSEVKNLEQLDDMNKDLMHFINKYHMYLEDHVINLSNELNSYTIKAYDDYIKKLNFLHGDSKVYAKLNREYTTALLLQNLTNTMDAENVNAVNEVLYVLSNDADTIVKTDPEMFQTKIGNIVRYMVSQYNYNLDNFYADYPQIKQFKGYTDRINAHIKFQNKMDDILVNLLNQDNITPEQYIKYKEAYSGIMGDLMGFRRNSNPSIDSIFKNTILSSGGYITNSNIRLREELKLQAQEAINKLLDLKEENASAYLKVFDSDTQNDIVATIQNYINDCLDHIEDYSLNNNARNFDSLTILRPTPDHQYVDDMYNALGKRGILGDYQTKLNRINEKSVDNALKAQDFDETGLINVVNGLRDGLITIANKEKKYLETALPRAYVEQLNGKTIAQINGSMNVLSFVSADNYTDEFNKILKDRNYLYDAFGIHYDLKDLSELKPRNYIPVESEFTKLTTDIREVYQLDSYQMTEIADIAALSDDLTYTVQKQIFIDYFDEIYEDLSDKEKDVYERFLDKIINYKSEDIYKNPEKIEDEVTNIRNSVKAYFGAAKFEKFENYDTEFVNARTGKPLTKMQNLINHTTRYAEESNRMLNELFTDSFGNINYALMAKYIQSNPYMKLVAMIPSDRYNNFSKKEKIDYQVSAEFVDTTFKSPDELKAMLTHTPEVDGIRYFVVDKHNLMTLKQMIGQTTSHKTYTNRQIFKNNPVMEKLMRFRDVVAKYVLLPTKILGLQNLGFTTTNAVEGFMKALVATEGSKIKTVSKYKEAIQLHRRWNKTVGIIAEAIQGSPFCMEKNQWSGMLKELENSKILFGKDVEAIKLLLAKNDIEGIKKLMPSINLFNTRLHDAVELTNFNKHELLTKYKKLWNKSKLEQLERIESMAKRYVKAQDAYNEVISDTVFTKEQFDFVNDFVNSPAAAAEMQSIKKANELNLIGNKKRYDSKGNEITDSVIDRFYKKALFSDWGMGDNNPLRYITPYFNLSLNSDIETINRLALHMDLLDKGFRHSESYNRVLESFFNYGDKSEGELIAELFFPFISFPFRTTLFWDQMLDEHPQMIKIFADLVLTNWGKDAQNQYNQTGITKGGLKISPNLSMESGSSFLDSLVFGGNALNVLRTRKLNPLLGPLVEGATQLATGEANWNYRLSRLPIVSKVMYGMDLSKSLSKGKVALYDIAPSIFHKVYKDNTYYFNNQRQYQYKSIYSRLYTATGYNRWNAKTAKGRVNAIKNLYGIK